MVSVIRIAEQRAELAAVSLDATSGADLERGGVKNKRRLRVQAGPIDRESLRSYRGCA